MKKFFVGSGAKLVGALPVVGLVLLYGLENVF